MAIRVLYIHNGADLYGGGRYLLRLLTRLDRQKFEPVVILPYDGPLAVALRDQAVEVVLTRFLGAITRHVFGSWRLVPFLLMLPLSVLTLARFMIQKKIMLVHTNTGGIVTAGLAARLAGVKHVWHFHDSFHEFKTLWRLYARYVLWASNTLLCVSESVARQFEAGRGNVVVLHNGLPEEEFESIGLDRIKEFKNSYGLENKRTVGVIGRIKFQRKGQDVFVKAVARLKNRIENVRYLIVGSPFPGNESHLVELKKLIKELQVEQEVVFTGDLRDTRIVFQALDILVLPSCFPEPFGTVVLEAMAARTPVIGTRLGGTLEQIEDGVSGILVEPNDPQMLAEKIELLLTDDALHEKIRFEGRRRYEERFRFQPMLERLELVYDRVLSATDDRRIEYEVH